jgi:NAD(P)-dependent dehydrogenase (short-subunit alcohol dehydrogenase family)
VRREATPFGQAGARICSVTPGIIDTPMGRQEGEARGTNDLLVKLSPIGREGHADEVAAATAFLLSDEASFITGIDVPVDGGVVAAIRGGGVALT